MILDTYPAAAQTKDVYGKIPLYVALEKGASPDIVKMTLDAYPAAAEMKGRDGKTPLREALEKGASPDILFVFVFVDFPLISDGSHKVDHHFTWTDILDPANSGDVEILKTLVVLVFEANIKHAAKLATVKDRSGREAIQIAHPDVKAVMQRYILFLGAINSRFNMY
jgi:hypothetical protein